MADATDAEREVGEAVGATAAEQGTRRVEVVVKHTSEGGASSLTWIVALVILFAVVGGMMMLSGDESATDAQVQGRQGCNDGIDNDGGGQADADDPDCYSNPDVWKGYDPNRSETNSANDGPGRP